MDRFFMPTLLAIIICGSLINSSAFVSPTLTAYFCYTVSVTFLASATFGWLLIFKNSPSIARHNWTQIGLFLGWIVFYLLQPVLFRFTLTLDHPYFAAHLLLFVALILLLGGGKLSYSIIFLIMCLAAIGESIICFLQLVGVSKSLNHFFSITGSWVNPNVTAMYLAMSVPAIFYTILWGNRKKYRYIGNVAVVFLIVALLLLGCRAALIATGIVAGIILSYKFSLVEKVKSKLSFKKQVISTILFCLVVVAVVAGGYYVKKNSSDGRLLIWKLCVSLGKEKPLTGHGLGTFERYYNLYQSLYFESNIATNREKEIASYVRMAYSEPLQNFVEGGFVPSLLFAAMLLAVLIKPPSKNNNAAIIAYAGIAGFFVMSIVNFTVQAIPVMCLLVIYFGIHVAGSVSTIKKTSVFQMSIYATLFGAGILLGFRQWRLGFYYRNLQEITKLTSQQGGKDAALTRLASLKDKLPGEYLFWRIYARALYEHGTYSQSIAAIESAIAINPDPGLYTQAGRIYFQLRQYTLAEQNFIKASYLEPYKMEPVMELMTLYQATGNFASARAVAQSVLKMKPRGVSAKAEYYKQLASSVLKMDSLSARVDSVGNLPTSNH